MWQWIIDNKNWFFSGIGYAIPLAIIGWLIVTLVSSKGNKKFIQKNKKKSANYQAEKMFFSGDKNENDTKK